MYRLFRFGNLILERSAALNQVENVGSGPTPTNYHPLPEGGALDRYGSRQMAPGVVERVKQARLRADTPEALEDLYFRILALRGKRDKLYRLTTRGDIHWQYARLVEVVAERNYELSRYRMLQDVELRFATQDATWRGTSSWSWTLDAGEVLDTGLDLDRSNRYTLSGSPTVIDLAVGDAADPGRAPVRAVRILVTAGSGEMSNITIARTGGESLTWTGTLPAAGQLVIDCGTMQVTATGTPGAYNNLVLSPTDMGAWFTLQPGSNQITVSYSGSGSRIEFRYYEAWY